MNKIKVAKHVPNKWALYPGVAGESEYVALHAVVGVKYPDNSAIMNGVTLRMSNGHYVATSAAIETVLQDLNALYETWPFQPGV